MDNSATARLIYLMGASGAGKDSLIAYARGRLPAQSPVVFAHRYITRPCATGGEDHVPLSEAEFALRHRYGCFAMSWESHGLRYGVGVELHSWMGLGLDVVVNGSRAYLEQARHDFPSLVPVLIQATDSVLRHRLARRGRENRAEVEARIARTAALDRALEHPAPECIENNADLATAGDRFLALLVDRG